MVRYCSYCCFYTNHGFVSQPLRHAAYNNTFDVREAEQYSSLWTNYTPDSWGTWPFARFLKISAPVVTHLFNNYLFPVSRMMFWINGRLRALCVKDNRIRLFADNRPLALVYVLSGDGGENGGRTRMHTSVPPFSSYQWKQIWKTSSLFLPPPLRRL